MTDLGKPRRPVRSLRLKTSVSRNSGRSANQRAAAAPGSSVGQSTRRRDKPSAVAGAKTPLSVRVLREAGARLPAEPRAPALPPPPAAAAGATAPGHCCKCRCNTFDPGVYQRPQPLAQATRPSGGVAALWAATMAGEAESSLCSWCLINPVALKSGPVLPKLTHAGQTAGLLY